LENVFAAASTLPDGSNWAIYFHSRWPEELRNQFGSDLSDPQVATLATTIIAKELVSAEYLVKYNCSPTDHTLLDLAVHLQRWLAEKYASSDQRLSQALRDFAALSASGSEVCLKK